MKARGTVTGRFSCKEPNLAQVPRRDVAVFEVIRPHTMVEVVHDSKGYPTVKEVDHGE